MSTEDIKPGQRWVSDAEPELGLGVVMSAGNGRVSILTLPHTVVVCLMDKFQGPI